MGSAQGAPLSPQDPPLKLTSLIPTAEHLNPTRTAGLRADLCSAMSASKRESQAAAARLSALTAAGSTSCSCAICAGRRDAACAAHAYSYLISYVPELAAAFVRHALPGHRTPVLPYVGSQVSHRPARPSTEGPHSCREAATGTLSPLAEALQTHG